jgi:hypothetical protein
MALVANLAVHLAESSSGGGEVNPYLIGGIALAILLAALLAVVSIGGGRDHT